MKRLTSHNRTRPGVPALAALSLGLAGALLAGTPARAASAPAQDVRTKADAFLAPLLAARPASGRSSVILRVNGGLTPARQARLRALGADITRRLPLIGSVAATVPSRNLAKVAALPFVARLSADLAVQKCDEFTEASSGADTAFQQYGLTGQGVTVAVVDSGVYPYADISGRVLAGVSFVPNDPSTFDACGHGTHVAGIIGGNGKYSSGASYYTHSYYGVARSAGLVGVRVLDKTGQGSVTTVIAGIQWAVANKAKYNIRVMNLSLGHPGGRELHDRPALPGRRGRLEGRHRRRLRRRQRRAGQCPELPRRPQRGLGDGLRLHQLARQRPPRHHRRRDEVHRRPARPRPGRVLFRARPLAARPRAEAGHPRAGQPGDLAWHGGLLPLQRLPGQPDPDVQLHRRQDHQYFPDLLPPVGDLDGGPRGRRGRRPACSRPARTCPRTPSRPA